ncbi:MAG TPA: ECF transporter S component [Clostridiaceae bacterium]|nr:ECF transporter S component [Clostridiaceae bacterium]
MKTRKIVITSLFIAISFIGANIKIAGTVAFDSMPGFLASLIFGPLYGAIVGAVGHLLTSATSGFPLSVPVHMIIMLDMALTMALFGATYKFFYRTNKALAVILSSIIGVIINGPVSVFVIMPIVGKGVLAMLPILTLAALLNIIIAHVIYVFLPGSIKSWK